VRTLVVLALLGGVGYVFYAWATSGPESVLNLNRPDKTEKKDNPPQAPKSQPAKGTANSKPEKRPEPPVARVVTEVKAVRTTLDNRLPEPLTIPEARVNIIKTQTAAASRQGQILFLGKEIPNDGAVQKPGSGKLEDADQPVTVEMPFLAIETTAEECKQLGVSSYRVKGNDTKLYRRWIEKQDTVEPGKLHVLSQSRTFVRLQQGMVAAENELLGLVDPSVARNDTEIKIAKVKASQAEAIAAAKPRDEEGKREGRVGMAT